MQAVARSRGLPRTQGMSRPAPAALCRGAVQRGRSPDLAAALQGVAHVKLFLCGGGAAGARGAGAGRAGSAGWREPGAAGRAGAGPGIRAGPRRAAVALAPLPEACRRPPASSAAVLLCHPRRQGCRCWRRAAPGFLDVPSESGMWHVACGARVARLSAHLPPPRCTSCTFCTPPFLSAPAIQSLPSCLATRFPCPDLSAPIAHLLWLSAHSFGAFALPGVSHWQCVPRKARALLRRLLSKGRLLSEGCGCLLAGAALPPAASPPQAAPPTGGCSSAWPARRCSYCRCCWRRCSCGAAYGSRAWALVCGCTVARRGERRPAVRAACCCRRPVDGRGSAAAAAAAAPCARAARLISSSCWVPQRWWWVARRPRCRRGWLPPSRLPAWLQSWHPCSAP